MIVRNIKNEYSFLGKVHLLIRLILTKLQYPHQRIIRGNFRVRGKSMISFGSGLTTGVGCRIEAFIADGNKDKKIFFGNRIQLNDYVHISGVQSVIIGDDTLIASYVYVSDNSHGIYDNSHNQTSPETVPVDRPYIVAPVNIGSKVWIGEGVIIMPGVSIGDGCIIGAHSIVNKDIPQNSIAVGSPAKIIKKWDKTSNNWIRIN